MNSLDIYERSCLSPLEEKELNFKNTENTNPNNNLNNNNLNVNNFTSNANNHKNKKKGVPKLNFMK